MCIGVLRTAHERLVRYVYDRYLQIGREDKAEISYN